MENGVATLWKNNLQLSGKSSCKKQHIKNKVIKSLCYVEKQFNHPTLFGDNCFSF